MTSLLPLAASAPPTSAHLDRLKALLVSGRPNDVIAQANHLLRDHGEDARLHLHLGTALASRGRVGEAILHFETARGLAPIDPRGHAEAGDLLARLGRLDAAEQQLQTALAQDEAFAPAWKALGVLHMRRRENACARRCFERGAALSPSDAEISSLLGMALERLGAWEEAQAAATRSLSLTPTEAAALNAVRVFEATGAVDRAAGLVAQRFAEGMKARLLPDLVRTLVQTPTLIGDHALYWREASEMAIRSGCPKLMTCIAIGNVLRGERAVAQDLIGQLTSPAQTLRINALGERDRAGAIFTVNYLDFLRRWLGGVAHAATTPQREIRWDPLSGARPMLHLGESHCLSFAHHTFEVWGERRRIAPRLCLGAKAHHLGADRPNAYQGVVQAHLQAAPEGADVLLSFGEIDCRHHEGILHHHRRSGTDLSAIVADTTQRYIAFIQRSCALKNINIYCLGVPAPVMGRRVDARSRADRIEVVRRFNAALERQARSAGLGFIDQSAFTADADGASNGRHHCDRFHLGPSALTEIAARLEHADRRLGKDS